PWSTPTAFDGTGNSVICPAGVTRTILCLITSVTQRLPSGPVAIAWGRWPSDAISNSTMSPGLGSASSSAKKNLSGMDVLRTGSCRYVEGARRKSTPRLRRRRGVRAQAALPDPENQQEHGRRHARDVGEEG